MNNTPFPWLTFLLMISFASVNAVIPTPALPEITHYFEINNDQVQLLMSLYLIGYAVGQLIYGPLANRLGRKPALYVGILVQILSNIVCIMAGVLHCFSLLPIARLFMGLGAGVGLKMAFTLVNEMCNNRIAAKRIAILVIAFAIAPGLAVGISSVILSLFSWQGCFYFALGDGLVILILVSRLQETLSTPDNNALNISYLITKYRRQFQNKSIIQGGVLLGCASSFIYLFATWAPFISITGNGYSEKTFALMNLLPTLGMLFGAITSAYLTHFFSSSFIMKLGVRFATFGVLTMLYAYIIDFSLVYSLFLPMTLINFALSFVFANASSLALRHCDDTSNGSAVMNFINMGMTAIIVLTIGQLPASPKLLVTGFIGISSIMALTFKIDSGISTSLTRQADIENNAAN